MIKYVILASLSSDDHWRNPGSHSPVEGACFSNIQQSLTRAYDKCIIYSANVQSPNSSSQLKRVIMTIDSQFQRNEIINVNYYGHTFLVINTLLLSWHPSEAIPLLFDALMFVPVHSCSLINLIAMTIN